MIQIPSGMCIYSV